MLGSQDPVNPKAGGRQRSSLARWVPVLVLAAGFGLFFAFGLQDYLTFAKLKDHRDFLTGEAERLGYMAGLIYIGVYAVVVAFSLPGGALLTLVAGFLFGPVLATVYVVVGATLGATALFLAARTAIGDLLERKAGPAVKKMEDGFRENALSYLLVLRLVPVFPFWLVNLVPALIGIPLSTYVLGTFVGIIPGTFVYASVGNGLGEIFDSGSDPDLGVVFQWEVLLPLLGLAVLALLPVLYKALSARRKASG